MGTRSLTRVQDGSGVYITMYRQYDGYPSGHGLNLAQFLKPFTIVNGFGGNAELGSTANGMGCLAAQIVAHFKTGVGAFYLYPARTSDIGEEYFYDIIGNDALELEIKVWEIRYGDTPNKMMFKGDVTAFLEFCEEGE